MALELGPCKGTILGHRTKSINGATVVAIACQVDGCGDDTYEASIWITQKSLGMARRALKNCGFSVDAHPLTRLDATPPMLAGNRVDLVAEEYKGKLQLKVDIDARASKADLDQATQLLREFKKAVDPNDEIVPAGDASDIPF